MSTRATQLAAVPVVAALVAGGVWVTGGLIYDDFRVSMALTAVWMVATGLACLVVAVRHRGLRSRCSRRGRSPPPRSASSSA